MSVSPRSLRTPPPSSPPRNTLMAGDALTILRTLPADSIHCCVTSPPYFGLRSYGTVPQIWGGHPGCRHRWVSERYYREGSNRASSRLAFSLPGPANAQRLKETRWRQETRCLRCAAWRGELGSEASLDEYIAHLVLVFDEVRRVLRPDGTCWLNIGDAYAGSWGNYAPGGIREVQRPRTEAGRRWERKAYADTTALPPTARPQAGLKPKDLMLVPFRLALALQAAGWWVRSDIIWEKANPLPESVKDRPSHAHEYVFLLAKRAHYFYDADAIREPHTSLGRPPGNTSRVYFDRDPHHHQSHKRRPEDAKSFHPLGRNKRDVWRLATQSYKGRHYATFPEKLVTPMILAGTSPQTCARCGAPWRRVVEREFHLQPDVSVAKVARRGKGLDPSNGWNNLPRGTTSRTTIGWEPTCGCRDNRGAGRALVLDPFMGSGTVAAVAQRLGRDYLGIELNGDYITLAQDRIAGDQAT